MKNHSPYKKSKNLLTKTEADFYVYLKAAVNNDFHINKMTRMCDLVDVDKSLSGKEYMSYFRSISQYHIDFTLCDPFTFKPLICIELDDPSHERKDRIKRDEKVNKIFADINFPLLRIKTEGTYSVENLRNLIEINLKNSNKKSSRKDDHFLGNVNTIDNDIDQAKIARNNCKTGTTQSNTLPLIASCILVIFVIVITSLTFKKLSTHMISGQMLNVVKNNNSKLGDIIPKQQVNPVIKRNTSALTTKKLKPQKNVLQNNYTIADISVTSANAKQSNNKIKVEAEEVKIAPKFYRGSYTIEMVWEGNYKSGHGVIALLDCGTKYLLIEQSESGIQIEQSVTMSRKETHFELQPIKNSSENLYVITSDGRLQVWDDLGMVNEFNRKT